MEQQIRNGLKGFYQGRYIEVLYFLPWKQKEQHERECFNFRSSISLSETNLVSPLDGGLRVRAGRRLGHGHKLPNAHRYADLEKKETMEADNGDSESGGTYFWMGELGPNSNPAEDPAKNPAHSTEKKGPF